ncbi:metallophosphoesterase, PPA1498 family [Ferrithrix thermotolerans DSM 19514]|uniref:Metallophosphoesterase, PPA1498 family n=1 Tax=Ferrithrix thermotolerans DSM 19514 TaxID=1121881 RepID=A0A1M4UBH6_9ACTN|nr:metallophosphoesterase [Ferrithrix thermotolerans]SHE53996.1 metallophosphoesterase, PPA1498 family [Ferrithrix thermotolerans DSM 19514]
MDTNGGGSIHPFTSAESLVGGSTIYEGNRSDFLQLSVGPGESETTWEDLKTTVQGEGDDVVSLCRFVHITDFQLADVKSPSRFEYVNRYSKDKRFSGLIPGYRPQEFLIYAMVCELVKTINSLPPSELSGREVDLVLTTGDLIDNAQNNEVGWVVSLLSGGTADVSSGSNQPEFVSSSSFGDSEYWHPDGGFDVYKEHFGFPVVEGMLTAAMRPIVSEGLKVPWLGCNGNHEILSQGVGEVSSALQEITQGGSKSMDIGGGELPLDLYSYFVDDPAGFFSSGLQRSVSFDPKRRHITTSDLVRIYMEAPGSPPGHGFTQWNIEEDVAYFSYDLGDQMRVVTLDTAVSGGEAEGAIDRSQFLWLEEQLKSASSRYFVDGRLTVNPFGHDRYVVITSHHPLKRMVNSFRDPQRQEVDRGEISDLLHRYPNVILWLSGHTHVNEVSRSVSPYDRRYGFYEVTTVSIMDWPCQFRVVEILERPDALEVHLEMGNVDVPAFTNEVDSTTDLASWHRCVAYNVARLLPKNFVGTRRDRNVKLVLEKRH